MTEGKTDPEAPGWEAIDRRASMVYPGQTAHQYTSRVPYDLDSSSPLPAVTVFEARGPDSWHLIGYGLSELFEKSSAIPDVSGFGIECTLRVPRSAADERPPEWAVRTIQAVGHYVLGRGKGFDSGHCIDLGGPLQPDSQICGFACLPDPILGAIETVHGRVLFLRLVGLTSKELEIFYELELPAMVSCVTELNPQQITDLSRASWLDGEQTRKVVLRHQVGIGLD